jgi:hypothetical protein
MSAASHVSMPFKYHRHARMIGLLMFGALLSACSKRYHVGEHVMVEWEGKNYPAMILVIESKTRYRIHYDDYDTIWDESVTVNRIKGNVRGKHVPHPDPPTKVLRARLNNGKPKFSTFREGDKVQASWHGNFYPATITMVISDSLFRVHFDGYDDRFDENVEESRLKRR